MLARVITAVAIIIGAFSTASAQEHLKSGVSFRDCDECPEMVVIPAGSFTMGSPESEEGRSATEGPRHIVTIARAFALGRYEVKFDEWDACMRAGGCDHRPDDWGWGRGNWPVINVSWDDAREYVRWLSRKTGQAYRLPSEAEWEYAARAGTTTAFHFGIDTSPKHANYGGNEGKTVAVGSFPANAFGLHDVHGNVREWVGDCWSGSYKGGPLDGSAWTAGDCSRRVLRGGSWNNNPRNLRAASRNKYTTGSRSYNDGFRIARTLP